MIRRLNVIETSVEEIMNKWNEPLAWKYASHKLFIRCRGDGTINWNRAKLYTATELIERDNVRITKLE